MLFFLNKSFFPTSNGLFNLKKTIILSMVDLFSKRSFSEYFNNYQFKVCIIDTNTWIFYNFIEELSKLCNNKFLLLSNFSFNTDQIIFQTVNNLSKNNIISTYDFKNNLKDSSKIILYKSQSVILHNIDVNTLISDEFRSYVARLFI